MPVSFNTFDDIFNSIVNTLTSVGSKLTDFNQGSGLRAIVQAFAASLSLRETRLVTLQESFYIATATGSDLDKRAADFGLLRRVGSYSSGFVTITPLVKNINLSLPAGSLLSTADGALNYLTTQPIRIATTSVTVSVMSTTDGAASDLPGGTYLLSSALGKEAQIRTTSAGTRGGIAAENDVAFRQRFVDFLLSLAKCTVRSVQETVLGVPGVSTIIFSDIDPVPGAFVVFVDDGNGTATQATVDAATAAIEVVKAAGVAFIVKAIQQLPINVSLTVQLEALADSTTVLAQISAAITAYFNSLAPGQIMYASKVTAAAYCASNSVISVELASPIENITPSATQVIRASTINIDLSSI
jgi:uncharacterized phage protein gp47/JayE